MTVQRVLSRALHGDDPAVTLARTAHAALGQDGWGQTGARLLVVTRRPAGPAPDETRADLVCLPPGLAADPVAALHTLAQALVRHPRHVAPPWWGWMVGHEAHTVGGRRRITLLDTSDLARVQVTSRPGGGPEVRTARSMPPYARIDPVDWDGDLHRALARLVRVSTAVSSLDNVRVDTNVDLTWRHPARTGGAADD
nr:hypothetical protein [Micromonospora sp. DSM 115978]